MEQKRILNLVLRKAPFDLIESLVKPEEYRDIKPFFASRFIELLPHYRGENGKAVALSNICYDLRQGHSLEDTLSSYRAKIREFDLVCFRNGYSKNSRQVIIEWKGLEVKEANTAWSDGMKGEFFAIKLGKKLSPNTQTI